MPSGRLPHCYVCQHGGKAVMKLTLITGRTETLAAKDGSAIVTKPVFFTSRALVAGLQVVQGGPWPKARGRCLCRRKDLQPLASRELVVFLAA